mgnify:CR=1 FL=1
MKAFAFTDLLHTGICGGFISAGSRPHRKRNNCRRSSFPCVCVDGFVQRQPKGQRHQRKQRPIEKIHPKYLSVETEIHVSAEEQAANLVHQASAHPGHRTLEQRHARRAPAGAISRLTAAMAATQGEYSSVNVKKLNAASGEKMAPSASPRVETVVPVSTAMVLTTASFAESP